MGRGIRRGKRRRSALAGIRFMLLFVPLFVAGNHNWLHYNCWCHICKLKERQVFWGLMSNIIAHFKAHNMDFVISITQSLDPPIKTKSSSFTIFIKYTTLCSLQGSESATFVSPERPQYHLTYNAATHQRVNQGWISVCNHNLLKFPC